MICINVNSQHEFLNNKILREISANRYIVSKHVIRFFTWWCEEIPFIPRLCTDLMNDKLNWNSSNSCPVHIMVKDKKDNLQDNRNSSSNSDIHNLNQNKSIHYYDYKYKIKYLTIKKRKSFRNLQDKTISSNFRIKKNHNLIYDSGATAPINFVFPKLNLINKKKKYDIKDISSLQEL